MRRLILVVLLCLIGSFAQAAQQTILSGAGVLWSTEKVKINANFTELYGWGDHGLVGYLTSYSETDPVFVAAASFGISTADIAGWDALITNAAHTGDVTGATILTVAAGAVDIAHHSATGTPSATTYYRGDNTWSAPAGSGDMVAATYDPASVSEQLVGLTAIQTLTNKTLTGTSFNMGSAQSNLLYATGSNFLLDTDTSVNHVLSASKIIALIAASAPTIIEGTSALGTVSIASGACATTVTTTATGVVTTDAIEWSFNADPTAVTGYSPSVNGMLTILAYPTVNNVNFEVCNNLAAAVTPGAITLNWRIVQ